MGRTGRARGRRKRAPHCVNLSEGAVYRDLAVWLAGLGCYAPALLRPALFPGVGRGLQARHSFQPGSILLSIPRDALVTPSLAAAALPDLSDLPGPALLAAWLLLERRRGALSSHAPYIASLPRHYTTPYFCLSAELEVMPAWLRGPVELQREAVAAGRAAAAARGARTSLQEWAWAWASVNTRAVYLPDQATHLSNIHRLQQSVMPRIKPTLMVD